MYPTIFRKKQNTVATTMLQPNHPPYPGRPSPRSAGAPPWWPPAVRVWNAANASEDTSRVSELKDRTPDRPPDAPLSPSPSAAAAVRPEREGRGG